MPGLRGHVLLPRTPTGVHASYADSQRVRIALVASKDCHRTIGEQIGQAGRRHGFGQPGAVDRFHLNPGQSGSTDRSMNVQHRLVEPLLRLDKITAATTQTGQSAEEPGIDGTINAQCVNARHGPAARLAQRFESPRLRPPPGRR